MGRLYYGNLMKEYPDLGERIARKNLTLRALLQKDYGLPQDCTLTSMACIWGEAYYPEIEKIALKYGYNGKKGGTNPLVIRRIMNEFLKAHKMKGHACGYYGKGTGWNYGTVKWQIDKERPVLLNLWTDGRSYYKNHTVTVVGYDEYERGRFLLVYDNWNRDISMIDYKKLSIISSINYVKN